MLDAINRKVRGLDVSYAIEFLYADKVGTKPCILLFG